MKISLVLTLVFAVLNSAQARVNTTGFWSGVHDYVDDYTIFTENLYERYVKELQPETDYSDIKDQVSLYLASKFFQSNNQTNCTETPCENFNSSFDRFLSLSSYLTQIDYVVKKLDGYHYTGKEEKFNKTIIRSSTLYFENNTPVAQRANSPSYSISVDKTSSVTITKVMGFSVKSGFSFEFGGFTFDESMTSSIGESESITDITTEKSAVVAPAQTIELPPYSKGNITFNFYKYDSTYEMFLDFELDDQSTIKRPDFRYAYFGDANCCEPCLLFKAPNVLRSPVKTFLRNNPEIFQSIIYKNDRVVMIEADDGKYLLKNIPASASANNFGVDVITGPISLI